MQITRVKLLFDEVSINLNMFGSVVLNWIMGQGLLLLYYHNDNFIGASIGFFNSSSIRRNHRV